MSIWGARAQDNDDAADWLSELEEEPTIVALNDAFDEVLSLDRDEYLEVTETAQALVAAEVAAQTFDPVPAYAGLSVESLQALRDLAAKLDRRAAHSLVSRALRALRLAVNAKRSELFELMQEDQATFEDWKHQCRALNTRLLAIQARFAPGQRK